MRRLLVILAFALLAGCGEKEVELELPESEVCESVERAIRHIELLERSVADASAVTVKVVSVQGMPVGRFKRELEKFPGERVKVWMPGRFTWVLVGARIVDEVEVSRAMRTFSFDAECPSVAEVFASYAGMREEIMPAFDGGDVEAKTRPEFFLSREALAPEWLSFAGVDDDIAKTMQSEILAVQEARRQVVEGDILAEAATDLKGEKPAIERWATAAERNPSDSFLLERVENLERNAKGFLEVGKFLQAMKCFETIVSIYPNNAAALHNFGICLRKLGKTDLANRALERAEELLK